MKRKRLLLVIATSFCLIVFGSVLVLNSSMLMPIVNIVARGIFGLNVHATSVSLSQGIAAEITNLAVDDAAKGSFQFSSATASIHSRPAKALSGEIERIVLQQPKLRIRIGNRKDTETDLSFIKKIPPVDLLVIEKGQVTLLFTESMQEIVLKDIDLTVKNFSPERGGSLKLKAGLDVGDDAKTAMNAHGLIQGELNLSSIIPRPLGKGSIHADLAEARVKNLIFSKTVLDMPISFEKNRMRTPGADISAASVNILNQDSSGIKRAAARTRMAYGIDSRILSIEHLSGQIQSLAEFTISGSATLTGSRLFDAHVEASQVDFSNLYNVLQGFISGQDLKKWSFQGQGRLTADVEGSFAEQPALNGRAALKFQNGGFSSEDGSKAGQDINGSVTVRFGLPSGGKKAGAAVTSQLSGGEYLWDKYYLDAKTQTSGLSASVDVVTDGEGDNRISGTLDIFNTGLYDYAIHTSHQQSSIRLDAREVSVKRLMLVLLQDYLTGIDASFKEMDADGRLDTSLEATLSGNDISLEGSFRLKDANFEIPGRSFQVKNLDAVLPLRLTNRKPATETHIRGEPESKIGTIRIGTLTSPLLQLSGITVPITLSGSNIAFPDQISLPFYGGQVYITDGLIDNVLSNSRRLSFSVRVDGVNFNPLLNTITGITLPEPIEADFPPIHYNGGAFETEGPTTLNVFGGRIVAPRIHGENMLSREMKIGSDIRFYDIDLGKITDTVKVGKITGVVQGSIDNLLIEYGQPSQFTFEIESDDAGNVAQKVSVDAIENISILGTGSGGISAILKSGVNRFFKEYPYSRIGIRCSLENDVFSIRGTIHENNREYLIRRGFLRGIDVVNKDPENMVSFKDMQERISRVFREKQDEKAKNIVVN